jgi:hypothetical protein
MKPVDDADARCLPLTSLEVVGRLSGSLVDDGVLVTLGSKNIQRLINSNIIH